jgi:hypothetical protein
MLLQWLMINGSNFGNDITVISRVSYGPTGAEFLMVDCTMLTPHTSLNCTTSPGVGIGLGFSMVVDKQESLAPTTTYRPPVIVSVPDIRTQGYSTRVRGATVPCAAVSSVSRCLLHGASLFDSVVAPCRSVFRVLSVFDVLSVIYTWHSIRASSAS